MVAVAAQRLGSSVSDAPRDAAFEQYVLPEVEVFLGVVPRADYATPGGSDFRMSGISAFTRSTTSPSLRSSSAMVSLPER